MIAVNYFDNKDQETIHVIGDSHSCFFYGADRCVIHAPRNGPLANPNSLVPGFKVYHVGPGLAFNLCKNNTTTRARERIIYLLNNVIEAGSRILLCFGEIDCRKEIFKAAKKNNITVEQSMEECVRRYVSVAKEIKARGYKVIVWGVVASTTDSTKLDPKSPRLGTCVERNILTRRFNERLETLLADESINFASLFEMLVDCTNETKDEFYLEDNVHLAQKMMPAAIEVIAQAY